MLCLLNCKQLGNTGGQSESSNVIIAASYHQPHSLSDHDYRCSLNPAQKAYGYPDLPSFVSASTGGAPSERPEEIKVSVSKESFVVTKVGRGQSGFKGYHGLQIKTGGSPEKLVWVGIQSFEKCVEHVRSGEVAPAQDVSPAEIAE